MSEVELPSSAADAEAQTQSAEGVTEITGCWSSYGVYGDGSCLELRNFVHCRNCPVYSSAGIRLIDRPLPPDYRRDWALHFAQEKRLSEVGSASVILFKVQDEWLGLPTHTFQEVAEKRLIHSLPRHRAGMLLGIANVRGELIVCISVSHLLHKEGMPPLKAVRLNYHRLLVVQWEGSRFGFPVEEVHGPQRFHPEQMQPTGNSTLLGQPYAQALLEWQGSTARLLDPHAMFSAVQGALA